MISGVFTIKIAIGIFFIICGLIFAAIERFMGLPFFYSIDQRNGVLNGFVCIVVGVILSASNINQGIFIGLVALAICVLEQVLILKFLKNKEVKFMGKEGIAVTDIKSKCKGYVNFNGQQEKVISENKNIAKDTKVIVSKLVGSKLVVKEVEQKEQTPSGEQC